VGKKVLEAYLLRYPRGFKAVVHIPESGVHVYKWFETETEAEVKRKVSELEGATLDWARVTDKRRNKT